MKLRVIILGFGCASIAMAEAPVAPLPTLDSVPPASAPAPSPSLPEIPTVDEAAEVPLDCDKRLGAYQFATQRYEAKVKAAMHTWEDVANYHSTRADWLQCVANGQLEAIKADRRARNELITRLNAANLDDDRLDEAIRGAQELFAQCDKAPLPADQAMKPCGPQSYIQACAAGTVKRLFARENGRSSGPREHMVRSILQQHLMRRVNLLQCVAERGTTPTDPLPEELRPQLSTPQKAAANR
jgi:hypothetical protein